MTETPNLNYIREISGGDVAFENQILDILKKELPVEVAHYHNCISAKDFKGSAEIVHKLKHKISTLGLFKSYQVAVDYENNLRQENFELKEKFEKILEAMLNFVKS